jgi:hypothetical protein
MLCGRGPRAEGKGAAPAACTLPRRERRAGSLGGLLEVPSWSANEALEWIN